MKSKKGFISFLLALTMSVGTAALASCGKNNPPDSTATQEFDDLGEYYCVVDENEWSLNVTADGLTLVVDGQAKTGEYTFDGETLSVQFTDGVIATATVDGDVMTLIYDGTTLKFYKKVNYTVTFETNGGSAVTAGTVVNGKTVTKPADPTKDGCVFIGWYEDSSFKTPYVFAKPVTSNMTLYARFVQSPTNPAEFTVKFVVDGQEAFDAVQTKDGVVYNTELPTPEKEGKKFVGWWVSDFEDANKLTYKYAEQVLGEHTTLYAVWSDDTAKISVGEKEITWTAEGVNNSYVLVIKNAAGEEIFRRSTSTPKVEYDFTQQPAGEYSVEVTFGGKTATAYRNNKALDKVCVFDETDFTVSFNAVANAEKYLLTIDCGNDDHQHTDLDLGTSTYYNFSACDMQVGGIEFTVKAVAEGYLSSTSDTFFVEKTLDQVTDLTVNDATETASWSAVENATVYMVRIENNGNVVEKTVESTSYSLKGMTGEISISVYPAGNKSYNPAAAVSYVYTNNRLAVPSGLNLSGQSVVWTPVAGATKYNVKIGNNVYESETASFALKSEHFPDGADSYTISVQALAADAAKASLYSDSITINCNEMADTLAYSNGSVTWDYVLGAARYGVKVNDGEEKFVDNTGNSFEVTLTQKGVNTIYVRCYDATNEPSEWVSMEVTAYAINFEMSNGEPIAPIYKAQGDSYVLPVEASRNGYNFVGWYDIANGPENNGTRQEEGVMAGDLTVYAGWSSKSYLVTFDLGEYGELSDDERAEEKWTVYYAKDYELPAPTVANITKAFAGWYTMPHGEGLQYTDHLGGNKEVWNDLETRTLYAHYVDVFTFALNEDDNNQSYSVAKGAGTNYLPTITIPAYYNDLPVTRIDSEAFKSCTALKEINIPDTVTSVVMPNGGTGTGSAFYGCTAIRDVNVYCSCENETAHKRMESRYTSVDGVLFYNNENSGMSVVYIPHSRTGSYTLPSMVKLLSGEEVALRTIPTYAFRNIELSEIVIPATVTKIESSAFYAGSTYAMLESVVFAPAADGEIEVGLEIMSEAFFGQSKLTSLILPARLKSFDTKILNGLTGLESIEIVGDPDGETGQAKYASVEGMLTNYEKTEILFVPRAKAGEFTINTSSITTIGAAAAQECDAITSIVIPAHVTEIKAEAFRGCGAINSIVFEGTAKDLTLNIRQYAFYDIGNGGGSGLNTINLPENIGAIEQFAFGKIGSSVVGKTLTVNVAAGGSKFANGAFGSDATSPVYYVETVNLGKGAESFSIPSVFGTTYLRYVHVDDDNEYYTDDDEGVLYSKDMTKISYFPAGISEYEIPGTVAEIEKELFKGKTDLRKLIIPASVKTIGDGAFYGCSKLKEVIFGTASELKDGETAADELTIGANAFYNCILTTFELPDRLTTIGEKAFIGCDFTTITIPKNVTRIGSTTDDKLFGAEGVVNAFAGSSTTSLLTQIIVDEDNETYMSINGVLYVKDERGNAVALCYVPVYCELEDQTLVIPKTVTAIYAEALIYNENVSKVVFEAAAAGEVRAAIAFGTSVFQSTSVTQVELPEGLSSVAKKMFSNATSLEKIVIPTTVTEIDNAAFYNCTSLTEVVFTPRSETDPTLEIKDASSAANSPFFYCKSLKKLILPKNTRTIGKYAVCIGSTEPVVTVLEEVFIPNTVTSIGQYAFQYCNALTKVTFEEGIKLPKIDNYTFHKCESLTTIDLPDSITSIGNYAFDYCGFDEITIPKAVTSIGTNVFYYAQLSQVHFEDGIALASIGNSAFYRAENLQSISIPSTVTTLGTSVFGDCRSLTSVTFETNTDNKCSLSSIGTRAFQNTRINELYLPESTAEKLAIGTVAFQNCTKLAKVTLNGQVESLNQVFVDCPMLKTFVIPATNTVLSLDESKMMVLSGSTIEFVYGDLKKTASIEDNKTYTLEDGVLTIKEGVEEINAYAFQDQVNITKVKLPATLKQIGSYAFFNCVNLKTVEFAKTDSDSVFTSIGTYAFKNCVKLENINMPTTTATIGASAFRYCTSLKTITLPASLQYSKSNAQTYMFADCYSLETVTFETGTEIEYLQSNMFQNCYALKNITIPDSVKELGASMFQSCTSLESMKIPKNVTKLPYALFAFCTSLTKVQALGELTVISDTTTTSYNGTFDGCTALVNFTFSTDEVTKVGPSAYRNCVGLTKISLPKVTGTDLYDNAFDGCTNLSSVTLSDDLTSIKARAFANCTSLSKLNLPSKLDTIATYAFSNSGLTEISIPNTVKDSKVDTYAFTDCAKLKKVTLSTTLTTLKNYTFQNCIALESIEIPANITTIQQSVFIGCTSLKSITLPKLNTAGANIFNGCTSLENVTMAENTVLGNYMFANCTSLKKIAFPTLNSSKLPTITTNGTNLLQGCTSLESVELSASFKQIPNYTFYGCTNLTSVTYTGDVVLTSIGTSAFEGCTSLEKFDYCATSLISDRAFYGCTALKEYNVSATSINMLAFANSGLQSVTIPSSVRTIKGGVFNGCVDLLDVTVDNEDFRMENGILYNAANQIVSILPSVEFEEGLLAIDEGYGIIYGALIDNPNVTKVVIPASMVDEDGNITTQLFQGSQYIEEVVLPEGLKALSNNMFYEASALKTVELPSTLVEIGRYAFQSCKSLESLDLPEGVTTIQEYTFRYSGITSIKLPESFSSEYSGLFMGCESLETVEFAENCKVKTIKQAMFSGCSALQSINLPDSITLIESSAFMNCTKLASVRLPKNLQEFGSQAFMGSGLESIVIPASVETWASYVFQDCVNLETAVIEEGFRSFGWGSGTSLFAGCTSLTSVELPSTLLELPSTAFKGCSALKSIYIPENCVVSVTTFEGWTSDQTIYTCFDLRQVMQCWGENWNLNNEATLVTGYVPENDAE